MEDSFGCKDSLKVDRSEYTFYNLQKLSKKHNLTRLPYSLRILLENLIRNEDGTNVTKEHIEKLLNWQSKSEPDTEISFSPARVLLQDFTGVPVVVDLAVMRDAMLDLKSDPEKINPKIPVDLVIDHSVMVDVFGNNDAYKLNVKKEYERNQERYAFFKYGTEVFNNFRVVPPGTGICHQVNLEYLAKVTFDNDNTLYPDTLVGTDSHTTMINGLGVLGWGVGGIEAEASMLGQAISMLIPQVIGFKLSGSLPAGSTATDLVLTVTEMLRKKGVVGKFVEFYGSGLDNLPVADRATIANMSPEFGATCSFFPVDAETLKYLELTSRTPQQIKIVEHYYKSQGLFRDEHSKEAEYTETLELDLSSVVPCIAGPKRPQDKIILNKAKKAIHDILKEHSKNIGTRDKLSNGSVVIAAITSCTNTSNPDVMIAAGLIAKKANKLGIKVKPWVKTSLAPGSKVVTDYLEQANLMDELEKQGFNLVGYGCTTCIGNSGPLPDEVSKNIMADSLSVCAVLSGNRNFEGRIHSEVQNSFLASPPLVVIYALAGTLDIDFEQEPIDKDIYLRDLWPSNEEIQTLKQASLQQDMFTKKYAEVFDGDETWNSLKNDSLTGIYAWNNQSTYIQKPSFFDDISRELPEIPQIAKARVLVMLGDSVTTDHISPAGAISKDSPAAKYLQDHNVEIKDFNSYGSRRGNHEVMLRGTFANIRLKNALVPGVSGGYTMHFPSDEQLSIFDAAMKYKNDTTPLIVLAGKDYGAGSSRDWAAKGTLLLGIKAVIAESFERIHRSNLIGMGVLPLQFMPNQNCKSLQLDGTEYFDMDLTDLTVKSKINVIATDNEGNKSEFTAMVRIDTPKELEYYQNGGILHYVLRQLAA